MSAAFWAAGPLRSYRQRRPACPNSCTRLSVEECERRLALAAYVFHTHDGLAGDFQLNLTSPPAFTADPEFGDYVAYDRALLNGKPALAYVSPNGSMFNSPGFSNFYLIESTTGSSLQGIWKTRQPDASLPSEMRLEEFSALKLETENNTNPPSVTLHDIVDLREVQVFVRDLQLDAKGRASFRYVIDPNKLTAPATLALFWGDADGKPLSLDQQALFKKRLRAGLKKTSVAGIRVMIPASRLTTAPPDARTLVVAVFDGSASTLDPSLIQSDSRLLFDASRDLTPDQLNAIAPGSGGYAAQISGAMRAFGITTIEQQAMLIAQCTLETRGFTSFSENLNYTSAARLKAVFKTKFRGLPRSQISEYVRNPEKLANFVYSGRLGNSRPGDGWRFIGRGAIQLTGRTNYESFSREVADARIVEQPEVLADPSQQPCWDAAAWFWRANDIGSTAVAGSTSQQFAVNATRRINTGLVEVARRLQYYRRARAVLLMH